MYILHSKYREYRAFRTIFVVFCSLPTFMLWSMMANSVRALIESYVKCSLFGAYFRVTLWYTSIDPAKSVPLKFDVSISKVIIDDVLKYRCTTNAVRAMLTVKLQWRKVCTILFLLQ